MEHLEDPRELAFKVDVEPCSALESFIQLGEPASGSRSQNALSQSSQQSQTTKSNKNFDEKFDSAMKLFAGNAGTADFHKIIDDAIETSIAYVPEKRANIKAMDAVLDEFLEPEENGGLPKEAIRNAVLHVKKMLDGTLQVLVDRKVLQELLQAFRDLPVPEPIPAPLINPNLHSARRKARRALEDDSDEEAESANHVENEEGASDEEPEEVEHDEELPDPEIIDSFKDSLFIQNKRKIIGDGMVAEKNANEQTLKKMLDKVRDKRGELEGQARLHRSSWLLISGSRRKILGDKRQPKYLYTLTVKFESANFSTILRWLSGSLHSGFVTYHGSSTRNPVIKGVYSK